MLGKSLIAAAAGLVLSAAATGASATSQYIQEVPTAWLIQDYIGAPGTTTLGVQVWYVNNLPSSGCQTQGAGIGHLTFSAATEDEANRFWTLIVTAKTTGHAVGIYYDDSTCLISSFEWPPG